VEIETLDFRFPKKIGIALNESNQRYRVLLRVIDPLMENPRPSLVGPAAVALALALWPLLFPDAPLYYQVFGVACLYGTLALAWNLYALSGAVSLGHAAFFGLGAYGSALLDHYFQWPTVSTILLGSLASLTFGLLWALWFRRLRGVYLGLASLAAVEIPKVIIDNWDALTFGSMGMTGLSRLPNLTVGGWQAALASDLKAQYYLLFILALLTAVLLRQTMASKWGWALRALRENETAATAIGIRADRERTKALLCSSYLTGICGALYVHILGLVEPPLVFSLHISALPLIFSIFGGRSRFYGPFLGALILYPLEQLVFQPLFPRGHAGVYGVVIILTILFFPQGIAVWKTSK
jgi:branched-chain amino acid transport system permease protein